MKKLYFALILTLLALNACSFAREPKESPTMPAPLVEMKTFTPLPTSTSTVTPTITLTLTPTITRTPTLTPTQTLTPRPTAGLIWPRARFSEADVTWRQTYCAQEGQKLSCEIEYRKDSNGCYVGMSCYDACGWYYSVNTIPPGVESFSQPCLP